MVDMVLRRHAPQTATVGVVLGGRGDSVLPPVVASAITRAVAFAAAGRVA